MEERVEIRIPKHVFATAKLNEVKLNWPAILGVVGENEQCSFVRLSWLPNTFSGVHRDFVSTIS